MWDSGDIQRKNQALIRGLINPWRVLSAGGRIETKGTYFFRLERINHWATQLALAEELSGLSFTKEHKITAVSSSHPRQRESAKWDLFQTRESRRRSCSVATATAAVSARLTMAATRGYRLNREANTEDYNACSCAVVSTFNRATA